MELCSNVIDVENGLIITRTGHVIIFDVHDVDVYVVNPDGGERWYKDGCCIRRKDNGRNTWFTYDEKKRLIYSKDCSGKELWIEYHNNDNIYHIKSSVGAECWYKENGELFRREFRGVTD